jgi:arylsulfatase A-like enzyme
MEAHWPLQHTRVYDSSMHEVSPNWSSTEMEIFGVNNATEMSQFDEYFDNFRQLYATSIDYLDKQLVSLIDDIQDATDQETTIVVTSDHGENLGTDPDGNIFGHVSTLSEGALHVPLEVINPPDGYDERVAEYVSHLDLPALLVSLAHGEVADINRDQVPAERIGLGQSHEPDNYEYWDRMLRCVYKEERKYEWDSLGNRCQYRIDRNRASWQEQVESDVEIPSWAIDEFPENITAYKRRAQTGESVEEGMDDRTRDQLEDLGYL